MYLYDSAMIAENWGTPVDLFFRHENHAASCQPCGTERTATHTSKDSLAAPRIPRGADDWPSLNEKRNKRQCRAQPGP
jgi:hypothetical protein